MMRLLHKRKIVHGCTFKRVQKEDAETYMTILKSLPTMDLTNRGRYAMLSYQLAYLSKLSMAFFTAYSRTRARNQRSYKTILLKHAS